MPRQIGDVDEVGKTARLLKRGIRNHDLRRLMHVILMGVEDAAGRDRRRAIDAEQDLRAGVGLKRPDRLIEARALVMRAFVAAALDVILDDVGRVAQHRILQRLERVRDRDNRLVRDFGGYEDEALVLEQQPAQHREAGERHFLAARPDYEFVRHRSAMAEPPRALGALQQHGALTIDH